MTLRPGRVLAAAFMVAGVSLTGMSAASDEFALTATTGIGSAYLYRGIARSSSSAQIGVDGTIGGWRGRVWGNRPFRSAEPGELQSSLGYRWGATGPWQIELRGTHFWYVDQPTRGAVSHSFEADLVVEGHLRDGWEVGLMPFGDLGFQSLGSEIWMGRAIALTHWGAFLHWRAFGGTVAARRVKGGGGRPPIRDSYTYAGIDLKLPYRIAAWTTVYAAVEFSGSTGLDPAWSPLQRGGGTRVTIGCGVQHEF